MDSFSANSHHAIKYVRALSPARGCLLRQVFERRACCAVTCTGARANGRQHEERGVRHGGHGDGGRQRRRRGRHGPLYLQWHPVRRLCAKQFKARRTVTLCKIRLVPQRTVSPPPTPFLSPRRCEVGYGERGGLAHSSLAAPGTDPWLCRRHARCPSALALPPIIWSYARNPSSMCTCSACCVGAHVAVSCDCARVL